MIQIENEIKDTQDSIVKFFNRERNVHEFPVRSKHLFIKMLLMAVTAIILQRYPDSARSF